MALYFNLPVYKESYDLLLQIFEYSAKLPREYRYTLGERLKNESTDILLQIFEASLFNGIQKKNAIDKALFHLEKCRLYIRLFKDLNVWGVSKQVSLNQRIESISKQLTQWGIYVARV